MRDQVKEYYGKSLRQTSDLKTGACCTAQAMPDYLKEVVGNLHEEVVARYYGCGLVAPELLDGAAILDLGSGSGRDCYLLAQLVGERGRVLGVDMTDEQLEVANRHLEWHRKRFGFAQSNVEFRKGYIEALDELDLAENTFDLIISNCVINLSTDKEAVFKQAYRLLKPGGELYFSDVYADRRVPTEFTKDPLLYGECLSGALYRNDFHHLARKSGFVDPRLVFERPIELDNDEIRELIGHIRFFSATYRLFKLEGLEPQAEDYGQKVEYQGTIPRHPNHFMLDQDNLFEKNRASSVCANTFRMLQESRLSDHFRFIGDRKTHYGAFTRSSLTLPLPPPLSGGNCC